MPANGTASVAFDTRFNDQNNARDSRGLSDFDRRQRFIASSVYMIGEKAAETILADAKP